MRASLISAAARLGAAVPFPCAVGPIGTAYLLDWPPVPSGRTPAEREDWPTWLARVGDRVREGRARRGLTVEDLVAACRRIPAGALAALETGEPVQAQKAAQVARLDVLCLVRLADALQVSLADLVGGPGESSLDTAARLCPSFGLAAESQEVGAGALGQRVCDRTGHAEAEFLRGLGKRLRVARLTNELLQDDLARETGLPRSVISSAERGARGIDLVRLFHLTAALQRSVADMITGATGTGAER
jgi:transcriptional regulator with XRE-family HTH domain